MVEVFNRTEPIHIITTIMSNQTQQTQRKIITVFGATGKQGGAVVCSLLKDGRYKVRGVSRSRDVQKSQRLEEKGVEMIRANISTGEGLDNAFEGAYAAFLITASFDNEIEGKECECGQLLVDKAKEHGVKVLVWSTLPHAEKLSGGKYNVPHFTEKAKVEEYIRNLQKNKEIFESVLFIAPAFYYQNFNWNFSPKQDEHGCYIFKFPKVHTLAACDINDLGPLFLNILKNPRAYNGKTILLEGECGSPRDYVHMFQEVTGSKACLKEMSQDELKECAKHHSKELSEMFGFMDEYTYFGKEKDSSRVIHAREIYPQVKNWETYLRESEWKGQYPPKS